MNKYIFSLIFVLSVPFLSFSQNLVPNASFETYKNIPCGWSTTAAEFASYVDAWYAPTNTSTDFHSTLCGASCWANPTLPVSGESCRIGMEEPHSGNGMAGFYTKVNTHTWHEYIQVKLVKPLIPGQRYCIQMWVSAADNVSSATNNIGMYFSKEPAQGEDIIEVAPQFNYTEVITKTDGWVLISGSFIADNDGQYLTIGNFFKDEETKTETISNKYCSDGAYYYIDDIAVTLCPV